MSLSPLYLDLTSDLHVSTAFERPSSFRLTSFGPGKVRYLSGPSEYALLQIRIIKDRDRALLVVRPSPVKVFQRPFHRFSLSLRVAWFPSP